MCNLRFSIPLFAILTSLCITPAFAQPKSGVSKGSEHKAKDPLKDNIDPERKPGTDFWLYANGAWFKANPIPPSESTNGIFLIVQDSINNILHKICDDCSRNPGQKGSIRQKIGDFYATAMDTVRLEKEGSKPLAEFLVKIDKLADKKELLKECAYLQTLECNPMFTFYITRDDMISSKYALFIQQGGLGLPDRDYYFNTDDRTKKIRDEYKLYIKQLFILSGQTEAEAGKEMEDVMIVETKLAQASRKIEDMRDPYKNYNKYTWTSFLKLSPNIEWQTIFSAFGVSKVDTLIVGQPEFVTSLGKTVDETSLDQWKSYMRWKVIDKFAIYLDKRFELAHFHFNHAVMMGSREQKPRWKRMVELTEHKIGEVVAQEYVAHYVPADAKPRLLSLAKNVVAVYSDHIKNLDWMSDQTKAKALHKLSKVTLKMGYPDKWKDFSKMDISRTSFVQNVMHVDQWYFSHMVSKYGKPVDRIEWQMNPQTYNAYYEPTNNEIVIPACNLIIPGFGTGKPDDAVLYGVIAGSTMGHELTHGFDDQGCQYDENGNLHNWWTSQDSIQFSARANMLADQFSQYVVLDSLHVRGHACLGENIADLGGVIMGYEAFKKTDQWKQHKLINGQTPDQRYFLAYAYSWMTARRDEAMARQIMTDVHAPAQWRVNGPLSDIDGFYDAFPVKPGDKMYKAPKDRVKIW
ncbi:MAG: M13 family metallopeptidase [Bacteroidia bacterium]